MLFWIPILNLFVRSLLRVFLGMPERLPLHYDYHYLFYIIEHDLSLLWVLEDGESSYGAIFFVLQALNSGIVGGLTEGLGELLAKIAVKMLCGVA